MSERVYPKRIETRQELLDRLWKEDDENKRLRAAVLRWSNECTYISNVTSQRGNVQDMNNDKQTFISYCRMQMACAEREGFRDVVVYIRHCLDDLGAP